MGAGRDGRHGSAWPLDLAERNDDDHPTRHGSCLARAGTFVMDHLQ